MRILTSICARKKVRYAAVNRHDRTPAKTDADLRRAILWHTRHPSFRRAELFCLAIAWQYRQQHVLVLSLPFYTAAAAGGNSHFRRIGRPPAAGKLQIYGKADTCRAAGCVWEMNDGNPSARIYCQLMCVRSLLEKQLPGSQLLGVEIREFAADVLSGISDNRPVPIL